MKTKQNDKAATYWLQDLANDFESGWIANPSAKAQGLRDRYEKKIKALINEHAALLAVAEAAKLNDSCWLIGEWQDNDRLAPVEARHELHNTLAKLDALRGEGAVTL